MKHTLFISLFDSLAFLFLPNSFTLKSFSPNIVINENHDKEVLAKTVNTVSKSLFKLFS